MFGAIRCNDLRALGALTAVCGFGQTGADSSRRHAARNCRRHDCESRGNHFECQSCVIYVEHESDFAIPTSDDSVVAAAQACKFLARGIVTSSPAMCDRTASRL
jgi:hypothetical protein